MNSADTVATERQRLIKRLLGDTVPRLWCPLITHYRDDGGIDAARMAAHLKHLSPWVKGFLIPGSTGDGWEMSSDEIRKLLEVAVEQASLQRLHLLIGVLKTNAAEVLETIKGAVSWLRSRAGTSENLVVLERNRVCGFTVCPPRGSELSPSEIESALISVLALGFPVSLYQLPQVTQNTMSPELLAGLAARFPNLILFKDTSGADAVALAGKDLGGVFMVRGAEGNYARWLRETGGPYDGFLLSTANCFGRELYQIISDLATGQSSAARSLSDRVSEAVREIFTAVESVPQGNAFANANKAADHFMAFGPHAAKLLPPRLHAGVRLPSDVIRSVGEILTRHSLMPERGYLE